MRFNRAISLALFSVIAAGPIKDSLADMALAQDKNCTACHSVEQRLIGPAFREIANKYRGAQHAEQELTAKVLNGSSGVWGKYRMPANTQATKEEAARLVRWILSL